MKNILPGFIMALLLSPLFSFSQNQFLSRDYWKTEPTLKEVKADIKKGNDPLALNNFGFNGVVYAMLEQAPFETIKYLLEQKGSDINLISHDGRTYLHWAAMNGDLELIKYVADQGAKDIVDDHGYNVLNFAAVTGQTNPAVYDYLLSKGAKLSDTNHNGANALLLLTPFLKDWEMIQYLTSKGVPLDSKDKDGNGIFFYVARSGNIQMMDLLISKEVSFKEFNNQGENAMFAAAQGTRRGANSIEVFQYLESVGVKANFTTKNGQTPLHALAARAKDPQLFAYFVANGVDVNQADEEGNTALILASAYNSEKIVMLLTAMTEDINASNSKGESALTKAVGSNSASVARFLLRQGADLSAVDQKGNSLAYYLIESYSPRRQKDFEEKLAMLKKLDLDFESVQAEGNNLLHLAAKENELYLIETVLALGVDINKKNDQGMTPLQIAAMNATDDQTLKIMLKNGADKSVKTDFDETVFDLASENEILAKSGIDISFLK